MTDPTSTPSEGESPDLPSVPAPGVSAWAPRETEGAQTLPPVSSAPTLGPPAPTGAPLLAAPWSAEPQPQQPPREPVSLSPRLVIITLVTAFVGNLAFQAGAMNTISMSLFVLLTAVALFAAGFVRTKPTIGMLVVAVVFGSFLTLRTEPRLIIFDLLAALTLFVGAGVFGRGRSVWELGPIQMLGESIDAFGSWLTLLSDVPADLAARGRRSSSGPSSLIPTMIRVFRGLIIAVPIIVVLGALLASADDVFASFLYFDTEFIGRGFLHLLLTVLAGSIVVGLQRKSSRDCAFVTESGSGLSIGRTEAIVVLGSVNLLFAFFALAQVYTLSGGAEQVMADAGHTFSDHARQGFFQLLWVAALTLIMIVTIWTLRRNRDDSEDDPTPDKAVAWLIYLSGLLTTGIIVVALSRLLLYIGDKGLTPLRFYSPVFSLWIGLAFIIVMVRVSGFARQRHWLSPAIVLSGMVVFFGLNLSNPEAIIASHNIELQSVEADVEWYNDTAVLGEDKLTGDGHQVLVEGAVTLPPELRSQLREAICQRYYQPNQDRGWTGYNSSESASQEAKARYCG